MKLELKHLAPYLPYGLQFKGKFKNWISFDNNIKTLCPIDLDGRFEIIKPILRPISDLEYGFKINCKTVIPNEVIGNYDNNFYFSGGNILEQKEDTTIKYLSYNVYPYWLTSLLFEWHFDVFGLIEQGLAVSIHDVSQVVA